MAAIASFTAPSLIATARGALWREPGGTIERLSGPDAALRAARAFPLVCHAPAVAARLGLDSLVAPRRARALRLREARDLLPADRARPLRRARPQRARPRRKRSSRPGRRRAHAADGSRRHGGAGVVRPQGHGPRHGARPVELGRGRAARARPLDRSWRRSRSPAPGSMSGACCRNGRSRRRSRRPAARPSSRAKHGCGSRR